MGRRSEKASWRERDAPSRPEGEPARLKAERRADARSRNRILTVAATSKCLEVNISFTLQFTQNYLTIPVLLALCVHSLKQSYPYKIKTNKLIFNLNWKEMNIVNNEEGT